MNMILRFYDPENGAITIGGSDIKNVTIESLRSKISVVSQEATLFDDTIRANIAYSKIDATDDAITDAASNAAAHDFIMEQINGYDTEIGQHGMKLSGGQRQRIAIARAMLRDAPILLLDEATSALDTVSEQQVQNALDTLMKGRTTVVIAHRLSTVMNSDIIYVIKDGQVAESGNHDSLLEAGGLYKTLYSIILRQNGRRKTNNRRISRRTKESRESNRWWSSNII
jgi:subfamily B ATP-binding cassette protein MsbA